MSSARRLLTLRVTFQDRGLTFRHFPDAAVHAMRWQAGRDVAESIVSYRGQRTVIHRFELVAWASTADALMEQLS